MYVRTGSGVGKAKLDVKPHGVGLWELCSKFPSLFYFEFLSEFLHYAQFYSFYAAPSIIIPYNLNDQSAVWSAYSEQARIVSS